MSAVSLKSITIVTRSIPVIRDPGAASVGTTRGEHVTDPASGSGPAAQSRHESAASEGEAALPAQGAYLLATLRVTVTTSEYFPFASTL